MAKSEEDAFMGPTILMHLELGKGVFLSVFLHSDFLGGPKSKPDL